MTEEKQEDIEVEVIAKIHTSGDRCGGRCALKGLEDLSEWHTCPLSRPFPDTPLETVVDYEPADALARSAWGDDIEYYRNDECFDAERAANELRAKADRADRLKADCDGLMKERRDALELLEHYGSGDSLWDVVVATADVIIALRAEIAGLESELVRLKAEIKAAAEKAE